MRRIRPFHTKRLALICLVACAGLGACTQFPELDAAQTPGVADAPYPKLVPLDGLLKAPAPRATVQQIGEVTGRVEGLRTRAARLQSVRVGQSGGIDARLKRLRQKAAALRAQE